MRFDYPGGVMPEEVPLIERFERDVFPYTLAHGPQIGEMAMNGDLAAEEIIRRQHLFVCGVPELREFNYKLLVKALKLWETRRHQ
jgi:hypothetical protein